MGNLLLLLYLGLSLLHRCSISAFVDPLEANSGKLPGFF